MSEITIENIIKIIVGLVVVVVVAIGLYLFFTNRVIDLFRNVGVNTTGKFLMALY
jgi:hypothetical protein